MPSAIASSFVAFLHSIIDLAGLVDDKEARHDVVAQANEVLMQGQQTGNVVSDPILTAAYLPKKVSTTR